MLVLDMQYLKSYSKNLHYYRSKKITLLRKQITL